MGKYIKDIDLEKYENDDRPIREKLKSSSKIKKIKDPEKFKKKPKRVDNEIY